jgi:solute carrier family 25 S-adenosylmethionine transporter 26
MRFSAFVGWLLLTARSGAFVQRPGRRLRPRRLASTKKPIHHEEDEHRGRETSAVTLAESSGMSRLCFLKLSLIGPLVAKAAPAAAISTTLPAAATPEVLTKTVSSAASTATTTTTLEESISGFIAGAALTTTKTFVKYPLDTATVRLQMPGTAYSVARLPQLFAGCYRGVTTPLVSTIPGGAVFFAVKDAVKSSLKGNHAGITLSSWQGTCLAVAVAQLPYWGIRNPSEVVKTRQQAGMDGYTADVGPLQAFSQVKMDAREKGQNSTSGLEGYYTGYWENILYAYPADVIKFLIYDNLAAGRERLSPLEGALSGAYATAIAQFLTTPLDVVRNRVMAKDRSDVDDGGEVELSYLETLVEIGRTEGYQGLLAGATPRIGKAFISGAIQFATYEGTKQELTDFFRRRRSAS